MNLNNEDLARAQIDQRLGEARDLGLEQSLKLGAICAAEVIQHYGARPETDLKQLAGDLLG